MPNFSQEEQRALSADELELVTRARYPQLREHSGAELTQLIRLLRERRDRARAVGNRQRREARGKAAPSGVAAARGNEGTVEKEKYLTAALRRATMERKRRQGADDAGEVGAKKAARSGAKRAPATRAGGTAKAGRKPRGPAQARGKLAAAPVVGAAVTAADEVAKPAKADKAERQAAKAAKEQARAEKQAAKAAKENARAEKQAEKAEKAAARDAKKAKKDKAGKDKPAKAKGKDKAEKVKADKPKADKPKQAKSKAAKKPGDKKAK
ncbi:MAG: hypothetical protein Q4G36_09585 [Paracoccus sp. (in: a-proteobacteria)]|nr:hypothetical protein [Paracoccus sp. (in: a-proteobacteria)]